MTTINQKYLTTMMERAKSDYDNRLLNVAKLADLFPDYDPPA